MTTQTAADLLAEVRRLRIRLTQLSAADLDAPASAPVPGAGADAAEAGPGAAVRSASRGSAAVPLSSEGCPASRREAVRAALAALARLENAPVDVPELGDRALADQLTVLLADCLPEAGASAEQTAAALDVAVALRRSLA